MSVAPRIDTHATVREAPSTVTSNANVSGLGVTEKVLAEFQDRLLHRVRRCSGSPLFKATESHQLLFVTVPISRSRMSGVSR